MQKIAREFPFDEKGIIVDEIYDNKDYNRFSAGRKPINVRTNERFIHFPRNLFGHFYYHVYAKSRQERNNLKIKIRDGIRYTNFIYGEAERARAKLGHFHAIHVRRNDFEQTRPETMQSRDEFVNKVNALIPQNNALYIATDHRDKTFF